MTELTRDDCPSLPQRPTFDTSPDRVTFFEDRAEVVRLAEVKLASGKTWVALAGITPFVDDRSLRVKSSGGSTKVLAARVVRHMDYVPAEDSSQLAERERERIEVTQRLREVRQRLDRGQSRGERLSGLLDDWTSSLARVPRGLAAEATLAGWRSAYDSLDTEARDTLRDRAETLALQARMEEEDRLAGDQLADARRLRPRLSSQVEVQLEADQAAEVELEVTYRTPCALWRPEHTARLATESEESTSGKLELVTFATAWQRTGERWEDVEVSFSTARPGRAANPPTVEDDVLSTRQKTDWERKNVVVEAREQTVALAGLDRGAREVDEMPGVDDGGEPLTLTAAERVTLPPDGRPFRIEVRRCGAEAKVERVLFPEVAPIAHVRATMTLPADKAADAPLLAGPVRLARGSGLVGRSKVGFVGVGEPFELGFGPDDAVRVRRDKSEERTRAAITGTQRVKRSVTVYLSNQSTDAKAVVVIERIPVSEIEDVEVTLVDAKGWDFDAKDGYLRKTIELAPRDNQELSYEYAIKAGSKVQLPF